MKKPIQPPEVLPPEVSSATIKLLKSLNALPQDKPYPHWDQLRHLSSPEGLSHQEWWQWLKFQRRLTCRSVALQDTHGRPFVFTSGDAVLHDLYRVDESAKGQPRDAHPFTSLVEEAITSSQLEGAATTRRVAKEMLLTNRVPRDRSERMILNNYRTMQRVSKLRGQALTEDVIFELHQITTEGTLDNPSAVGRFRRVDEDIVVQDMEGNLYHTPPPAAELPGRLAALCDFANGRTPDYFLHPVLRAIILHFWLAYDHPFVDGNGRTARALFYWSMLRDGYRLCEYLSISRILKQARAQYERAFLYTETDDNDLTYFIVYQLQVLRRAIEDVQEYINRKSSQQTEVERRLSGLLEFNHRQRAMLAHALHHPDFRYTIEEHRLRHGVVYQTARTDLLSLAAKGFLAERKSGRVWTFTPAADLERKLAQMS